MKKLILSLLITGTLILPLGDWIESAYCMSLETTEEVQIGLSKFKLPIFFEYDFSDMYGGCLVSVLDYDGLLSLDIGFMANQTTDYLNIGISANLEALCGKIGLHYRLPMPFVAGISVGRALYDRKNMVVFYIGLAGELDK